jgi:hypothetical protein
VVRTILFAVAALAFSHPAFAGAVDKFDKRPAEIEGYVAQSMFDIERCLINMDRATVPWIYRQPDRPDDTLMLWPAGDNTIGARIDLKRQGNGTFVRIWMNNAEVRRCAPLSQNP